MFCSTLNFQIATLFTRKERPQFVDLDSALPNGTNLDSDVGVFHRNQPLSWFTTRMKIAGLGRVSILDYYNAYWTPAS
jgi:hypothetical protein